MCHVYRLRIREWHDAGVPSKGCRRSSDTAKSVLLLKDSAGFVEDGSHF